MARNEKGLASIDSPLTSTRKRVPRAVIGVDGGF